jgi:hypothetical protein
MEDGTLISYFYLYYDEFKDLLYFYVNTYGVMMHCILILLYKKEM